jgi:hypothetical protein
MAVDTLVNIVKTKNTVRAHSFIWMGQSMKAHGWMTSVKDMEFIIMLMETGMKASGKNINATVREHIIMPKQVDKYIFWDYFKICIFII